MMPQRIRMSRKARPDRPTASEARAIVAAIAAQIVARVKAKTPGPVPHEGETECH